MNNFLTMDDAREATAPFHDAWIESHQVAWDRWSKRVQNDPEFTKPLDATARYKILNCHVTDEIEKRVPGTLRVKGGPGMLVQTIEDKATIRFKHLGRDLKPVYHSTRRQDELEKQAYTEELMEQLPLTEPVTALVCGYTLDPGEHQLSQVMIVCHYRDVLKFNIPLLGGQGGAEMIPFPIIEPVGPRVSSGIAVEPADDNQL